MTPETISWRECFTVIDFETTGVNTDEDKPTEIGVVRFEDGKVVDKCDYLINPQREIGTKAAEISKIQQADVLTAPLFPVVWEQCADLFDGAVPVAYNAPFDRRVLQNSIRDHQGHWSAQVLLASHITQRNTTWLDPLVWIRKFDKFKKGKKLTDACKRRDIAIEQAHRAMDDAQAAGELLLQLDIPELWAAAADEQNKLRVAGETDYQKYKARKAGRTTIDGAVWMCDSCHAIKWAEANRIPEGWARFHSHAMKARGEDQAATCSSGCDLQMRWWDKGLEWLDNQQRTS